MPELPEVETIRRDLLPQLRGRRFTGVRVSPDAPKLVQTPSLPDFAVGLVGRRVVGIRRRGKYLLLDLDDGRRLIVHLRMTGVLLLRSPTDAPDRYTRAVLSLDDGRELRFTDLRKFGALWLTEDEATVVGSLGPEPLDGGLTPEAMAVIVSRRSAPVKAVLLDQGAIAGIGNIYADEALFRARVNPATPARRLRPDAIARLCQAIPEVLAEALDHRGSSYRDYRDAAGREGTHQFHVRVFRRTGEACYECGAAIRRIKVAGRSTHFCPKCQPAPRRSAKPVSSPVPSRRRRAEGV